MSGMPGDGPTSRTSRGWPDFPDYTWRLDGQVYQIDRQAIVSGLRGADVRVEKRLDGSIAARHGEKYLPVTMCPSVEKAKKLLAAKVARPGRASQRGSEWNRNFDLKKGPPIWQAAQQSGYQRRREE